jgi:hypothetical protein
MLWLYAIFLRESEEEIAYFLQFAEYLYNQEAG